MKIAARNNGVHDDWSTPDDLGLPEKFGSFRGVQSYALKMIEQSKEKVLLIQAPTGTGKSLIGAGAARVLGMPAVYVSTTIDLQDQFVRDFPGAAQIMGRDNYPTLNYANAYPEVTCSDCDKTNGECTFCSDAHQCPYERAKGVALEAEFSVLNTAYFLNEVNHVGRFSDTSYDKDGRLVLKPTHQMGPRLVVLDEADTLERALMNFIEITVPKGVRERLQIPFPRWKNPSAEHKMEDWGAWLAVTMPKVKREVEEMQKRLGGVPALLQGREPNPLYMRQRKSLKSLMNLLTHLHWMERDLAKSPESWVRTDNDGESLHFKPIYVAPYAEDLLWRHATKFVVMSATIISADHFARDLGLGPEDVAMIDLPSGFSVKRRPIYQVPAANVTHKNKDTAYPRLVQMLDDIADQHPSDNILAHTVSYDIAGYVSKHLRRNKSRVITYANSQERAKALELFKQSTGKILVAPSMDRGVDLPDDLCRVVVILKVPYPYLGDRQISARFHDGARGRAWYTVETIRAICQMTGRGMRHEKDWCITYILDRQFQSIFERSSYLFPGWWKDALVKGVVRDLSGVSRIE